MPRLPAALFLTFIAILATTASEPAPTPDLRPRKFASLPFDLSNVEGLDKAEMGKEAQALLAKNGFVVRGPSHGNMSACYAGAMPVLVTVDSVLEVFLFDFEHSFAFLEKRQGDRFGKLQIRFWEELLARWERLPAVARPAAARLAGLIAVGCRLGQPEWKIPGRLPEGLESPEWRQAVEKDLAAVLAGEGMGGSALWDRDVDWAAFVPVGPYAGNEELQRYYRLSQWWGLQGLRAAKREEALCAGLLAWVFWDSRSPDGETGEYPPKNLSIREELQTIERTYDALFGPPDDVTVEGLMNPAGANWPDDFGSEKGDLTIRKAFERSTKPKVPHEWTGDLKDETKGQGLRLLLPRLTPESLCYGRTTDRERTLPNGLDAPAGFGDDLAMELTLSFEKGERRATLEERLKALRKEMTDLQREVQPLELQDCLRRLGRAMSEQVTDDRLPLFMRTREYRMRGLSAFLALTAAMREIYSPRIIVVIRYGGDSKLPGVVEPNLDAWQRLIELTVAARQAFAREGVAFEDNAERMALTFRAIAEKQLQGEELTKAEKGLFPAYSLRLRNLLEKFSQQEGGDARRIDRRVCVAFARSFWPDLVRWAGKTCCEMYVVVEYDGKLHLFRGGVFDYREFDQPPGKALTRTDFRALMDSKDAPPPPSWTAAYRVEPAKEKNRKDTER